MAKTPPFSGQQNVHHRAVSISIRNLGAREFLVQFLVQSFEWMFQFLSPTLWRFYSWICRGLLRSRRLLPWVTSLVLLCTFITLPGLSRARNSESDSIVLVGMGSTVPLPLYRKWANDFNRAHPNVQIQYLPLGTTEGIKQISSGNGDFGAGEVPLTAKERTEGKLLEVPVMLIGIVPIYNLPQVDQKLRFSGDLLAQIYLGHVKRWDAPEVARLNPMVPLPKLPIKVVFRPAGKGTNYVFSDFLSKTSSQFRTQIGVSPSPQWPVGVAADLSSDMAKMVKELPGAIGYVEVQYALSGHIQYGLVQNRAGRFIAASKQTIVAACEAVEAPHWDKFSVSLTDTPGLDTYPITSFTWIYLRNTSTSPLRRTSLADYVSWIFNDGQQLGSELGYSELPIELRDKAKTTIKSMR
jgi:phosphate transport system substrate-binding protein